MFSKTSVAPEPGHSSGPMPLHRLARIAFFSVLCPVSAIGQMPEPKFDHISAEEGLSHLTVTHIVQDKQGFLWVGTEHGLNRYDGFTFATYYPDPADSHSIGGYGISGMCVDGSGVP